MKPMGLVGERKPEARSLSDGGIIVRHTGANPRWTVAHVLQYGPEPEVLDPAEVREMVALSAETIMASG